MKEKVLISTIVRNRGLKLENYFKQIKEFVTALSDSFEFSISIYENDSTDDSKQILKNADYSHFVKSYIKSEDIQTQYYGSIIHDQRVINYANARNKTFEGVNLNEYDWLLIIEPDIVYTPEMIRRIITRSDLDFKPDAYSGLLIMGNVAYDKWGMRRDNQDQWGDAFPDFKTNPIREFWTTANGVCLYNMEPFQKGLKFNAYNKRFQKYDCDTAVLCEDLREMGYNKIFINQAVFPVHDP
jgi:hypothetical protein